MVEIKIKAKKAKDFTGKGSIYTTVEHIRDLLKADGYEEIQIETHK